MNNYWEQRYTAGGRIWGEDPSVSVYKAEKVFSKNNIRRIHIPGCGYGRNAGYFISLNYEVSGSEISTTACSLAKEKFPELQMKNCSILSEKIKSESVDAVYAFNILHLFRLQDRFCLVKNWKKIIRPGGLIFCTVFSELEDSFGNGIQTEDNTFESKPGRPVHYFTQKDLISHFVNMTIMEECLFDEPEEHERKHVHKLRYIVLKK